MALYNIEKPQIIIDIGIAYTKVGFGNENAPRKIIPTPDNLFKDYKEIPLQRHSSMQQNCFQNAQSYLFDLEDFLRNIFYQELLINASERSVIICENFYAPRFFIESLAHVLFTRLNVMKVFFIMANILPIYTTGALSGIVVNCGFNETQVCPVFEGFPIIGAFKTAEVGGFYLSQLIKQAMLGGDDEKQYMLEADKIIKSEKHQDDQNQNLMNVQIEQTQKTIQEESQQQDQSKQTNEKQLNFMDFENIKAKCLQIPLQNQYYDYISTAENIEKCKSTIITLPLTKNKLLTISYYKILLISNSIFQSNPDDDTYNIAYLFLKSIQSIEISAQKKLIQNIVFSGGLTMMHNFIPRFRQEVIQIIDSDPQFANFKKLKQFILITNPLYPANCLEFIGGISQGIEKFLVTKEQYDKNGLSDRIGNAFLNIDRTSEYFNPEVEDFKFKTVVQSVL